MKFDRQFVSSYLVVAAIVGVSFLSPAQAQVPQMINQQGFVKVNGANFNGTGYFRFALVDGAGSVSYWSNNGSSAGGSQPSAAIAVPVVNGLYSLLLGDTSIANMTVSIPSSIFANPDVRLRVWFDDGASGPQQLAPDQRIVSVGYTLMAADVANGTISASKLATASVTSPAIAAGAVGTPQLADGAISPNKLATGSVTAPAIAAGAVGNSALAADSVTSGKILDGTITDADISSTANINAGKIVGGDLQARRLKVGTNHILTGDLATIAGGDGNTNSGHVATIGGGFLNIADSPAATVGGGGANAAIAAYATVGGGNGNTASGFAGTVSGGNANVTGTFPFCCADYATVGGGNGNTSRNTCATVGGGNGNTASGTYATVGGGNGNTASGTDATIPGGVLNTAKGDASFAAGSVAQALHAGAFVWGDSSTMSPITSTAANQFTARATGGVRFITGINPQGVPIGVSLAPKASQWTSLSDRNAKENFAAVDGRAVLAKLAAIPIESWNYKAQDASIRHIGPMAQDFYAAFGLGEDKLGIGTMDADGVAFAALKGLNELVKEDDAVIEQLKRQAARQEQELKIQKAGLEALRRQSAALVTDLDELKSQVQQFNATFKSLKNSAAQSVNLSSSERFHQP